MPEPTIPPALSKEKWDDILAIYAHSGDGEVNVKADAVIDHDDIRAPLVDTHNPHGAAALCLYGQRYGFSQEDVDSLRDLSHEHHPRCQCDYCRSLLPRVKVVMAKIRALLPPPEDAR